MFNRQAYAFGHHNCCGCKVLMVPEQPDAEHWINAIKYWFQRDNYLGLRIYSRQQLHVKVPKMVLDTHQDQLRELGFQHLCKTTNGAEMWGKVL